MNHLFFSMVAMTGGLALLIMDWTLRGLVLLTAAGLLTFAMGRASAAARHLVWLVALGGLLVLPLLSLSLPQWRVLPRWTAVGPVERMAEVERPDAGAVMRAWGGESGTRVGEASVATGEDSGAMEEPAASAGPAAMPTGELRQSPVTSTLAPTWRDWLGLVWMVGVVLLVLRLVASHLVLRQSARRAVPPRRTSDHRLEHLFSQARAQLGVTRRVDLLVDGKRSIPFVWGVWHQRLVLPAEAREWSDDQLLSIFLHETAHIRRRDTLVQWLTQLACALHWVNPLVWMAAWRLHTERERACDDLVLAQGVRPSAYAAHLLHVASRHPASRWTQACGLAMARPSSLEGRLFAVLSEKLNRRGVTRTFAMAALTLGVGVAVPVAMLRATDDSRSPAKPYQEKPGALTEHTAKRPRHHLVSAKQSQDDPSTRGGSVLNGAVEAQLDWGEPVKGLRGSLIIRSPGAGASEGIYLVVQNVSEGPVVLADTMDADALRSLVVSASGEILFVLSNGEATQTHVTLQPREVVFLSMMLAADKGADDSPVGALIEGLRKDSLQTWRGVLNLTKAPAGAWSGKLTTADTRGALREDGPQPKDASAQALFKAWQNNARLNGDIPGGLVRGLQAKVMEFIHNNKADTAGSPYAQKMMLLEHRFENTGDWKAADVVALLDEVALAHPIPLETALTHLRQNTLQPGTRLPASLEKADWGEPLDSGLRLAYVLEPRSDAYRLGTELKARLILHNTGREPVAFVTSSFQQPGHSAKLADGRELDIDSTYWTTLGRRSSYRLDPGHYCEIATPGLGIGARVPGRDDWSNVRAGSWILCGAGDDVVFTPGAAALSHEEPPGEPSDWWLDFIIERLNRDAPLPRDQKEREYLLYRVVRDLYGTAPSITEGKAFAADTSPDALKNLAQLLARHPFGTRSHGLIGAGVTKFRVLPPDTDESSASPRVAAGPGWYSLGESVKLSVTRRPAGARVVNEASLIYFQDGKDNVVHRVPLPDGHDTWAAATLKGATAVWIAERGVLRKYDFSDPANPLETRYEGAHLQQAPIPDDLRQALAGVLSSSAEDK